MSIFISCPGCGCPAVITERFSLFSTDGPVDHVVVICATGHHFRMPADMLPSPRQQPVTWQPAI
jgi:hypothetical protein